MTIKVKILPSISTYCYEGKTYHPGDILEIKEENFVPYLMEKIEAVEEPEVADTEPTSIVEAEEPVVTVTEASSVAEEPKPKRTRRKT